MLLARFAFQACSFNHSDISPSLESTICERFDKHYPTRRRLRSPFFDLVCIEGFDAYENGRSRELCKTS